MNMNALPHIAQPVAPLQGVFLPVGQQAHSVLGRKATAICRLLTLGDLAHGIFAPCQGQGRSQQENKRGHHQIALSAPTARPALLRPVRWRELPVNGREAPSEYRHVPISDGVLIPVRRTQISPHLLLQHAHEFGVRTATRCAALSLGDCGRGEEEGHRKKDWAYHGTPPGSGFGPWHGGVAGPLSPTQRSCGGSEYSPRFGELPLTGYKAIVFHG